MDSMRPLLLIFVLVSTASAQTSPGPTVLVVDENGVAVPSARVVLQASPLPAVKCETDHSGRCHFPNLAPGEYHLQVEKEGYYALDEPRVQLAPAAGVEVTISHEQEVHEVVDVHESPPAIDPAQIAAQETISGLDVIDIVYPGSHDYRNVLTFIPGVVQDQFGQLHVAGAQTYQTVTLLDGFNITQPANGQLLLRVSPDAFRSIQVEPSRQPAEFGNSNAGHVAAWQRCQTSCAGLAIAADTFAVVLHHNVGLRAACDAGIALTGLPPEHGSGREPPAAQHGAVEVHIGRVEVVAVQPPAPAVSAPRRERSTSLLDDLAAHRVRGVTFIRAIKAWARAEGRQDEDIFHLYANPNPSWPWSSDEEMAERLGATAAEVPG